jgi:arylsulfatase A-like enzyme
MHGSEVLSMNAICLVVDRLHCGYLGCYGNPWIETPALDRLAAEGFLFDFALLDGPRLETLYRSYWHASHALMPLESSLPPASLPRLLSAAGIHTALVTDDSRVARHPSAEGFAEITLLKAERSSGLAADESQTQLAGFFAAAIDWLEQRPQRPFLLWLHCRSLGDAWDAPAEYRQRYVDAEIDVPLSAEVPHRTLADDVDPDELLGIRWSYAGQVTLLDTCLDGLLQAVEADGLAPTTLFWLLSARGFPLGEHRRVGPMNVPLAEGGQSAPEKLDEALFEEQVHTPWIVRFPEGLGAAARSGSLVQPADLAPTLLDAWGLAAEGLGPWGRSLLPLVRGELESVRDRAALWSSPAERAIRTPAWHLRSFQDASGPAVQLYAKPDDRWELNEVSSRCGQIVELLQQVESELEQAILRGRPQEVSRLDELLRTGLE